MQNLPQIFQTPASQKQKIFSDFLLYFRNVHEISISFKKKMNVLA